MRPNELHMLFALRQLGRQRAIRPIADRAHVAPSTASRSLRRLEKRGLVNIHRVELDGRQYIRWIVPVDITWQGAVPPRTTAPRQAGGAR